MKRNGNPLSIWDPAEAPCERAPRSERELEDVLESEFRVLFGNRGRIANPFPPLLVHRQVAVPHGRADLLVAYEIGIDVVEVKWGHAGPDVFEQVERHRRDISHLLAQEIYAQKDDFDWYKNVGLIYCDAESGLLENVRATIVASSFDERLLSLAMYGTLKCMQWCAADGKIALSDVVSRADFLKAQHGADARVRPDVHMTLHELTGRLIRRGDRTPSADGVQ